MEDVSPQLENGFTRIANEILDALIAARLTARQWAVAMAVIRKTYGFNKKEDDIGLSQIAEMTGIAKAHVSVAVRDLVDRQIMTREAGKFGHRLGINKRYKTWKGVTESVTPKADQPEAQGVTESVTVEAASPDIPDMPGVTESVTLETPQGGSQIGNPRVTESVTPPVTESVTTKDNPSKDNHQKTKTFPRSLRERFDIFWSAYPRKTDKQDALKAFTKLNPDDDLFEQILAGLEVAKRSPQWRVKRFIKHASVWLNKACWQDELVVDYTPRQISVIEAFNAALGERLGNVDLVVFVEDRASLIDDFLTFSRKDPNFWQRYFPWVAENVDVPPRCGFDWLIGRDGFTKVKGGQFTRNAA
ncbi:replication protein [Paraburkholderia caballeronis]|uniref:Phage replication protein O, N-terminal domain-containing protein n=1 Tax=Paraburkholderia caballeronis TaxID=416943 RepID=A0A1H7U068_9BURK|nr:replication protein [Paraburkholderia caballeronis]PXW23388.1 phage replication protein O [Paraburkholderia caballeronis]PXW98381.1 phage replication protein O [Paraburkholderia caballeronis]RAJ95112.1 phage replication protein O [Paraburkholderia caballeronis]SEC56502.1 phage replication protein O [Paraburkholderia caballeronis]SEL89627.1 phage replication protein O, N-terminal domain-containing protein [Paraburkholderia caballeronis]